MAHRRGGEAGEDRPHQSPGGGAQVQRVDESGAAAHGEAVAGGPAPGVGLIEVGGHRDDGPGAGELLLHRHALDLLGRRQGADEVDAVEPHPVDAGLGAARAQQEHEGLQGAGRRVRPPGACVVDQGVADHAQEGLGLERLGAVGGRRRAALEGLVQAVGVGVLGAGDERVRHPAVQRRARAARGQAVGGWLGGASVRSGGEAGDELTQRLEVSAHGCLPGRRRCRPAPGPGRCPAPGRCAARPSGPGRAAAPPGPRRPGG